MAWIKAALPALFLPLLSACAGLTVEAPFPERPDTVRPGSLRGPFDGRVLEQQNGNAVSAALVVGSWSFERRGAVPLPAGTVTRSVLTGSDGGYSLPVVPVPSGVILHRFTLVVYKAGFLGYRSDQRFEDRGRRSDFAQRRLLVRLERFPEGESHARHLVFLGGDGAVRRAAQAEVVQAALELSEQKPPLEDKKPDGERPPPPLPEARVLLAEADLLALSPGLRLLSEPLPDNISGERPGPGYDGVHYRATGKGESFDAALRLWRLGSAEAAEALYGRLKEALPGAKELDGLGPGVERAFRASDGKRRVQGVVALLLKDRPLPLLVQLACGASLCTKDAAAQALLQKALARLEQAPPGAARPEGDK